MRNYELMAIYPMEEDLCKAALETTRADLASFGVEVEKEEVFGDRDLAYEINKRKRGHFVLFNIKANPAKIAEIEARFKFNENLLRHLFVLTEPQKA